MEAASEGEQGKRPVPHLGSGGLAVAQGTTFTRVTVADFQLLLHDFTTALCATGPQQQELREAGVREANIVSLYPHEPEDWTAGCKRLAHLSPTPPDQGLARLLGKLMRAAEPTAEQFNAVSREAGQLVFRSGSLRDDATNPTHLHYLVALLRLLTTSSAALAILRAETDYGNSDYVAARVHHTLHTLAADPRFCPG